MALILSPANVQALQDSASLSPDVDADAPTRDLAEALLIARGQLKRCAEVRHLIAMAVHIADLREAIEVRDELLSALTSGTAKDAEDRS